MRTLHPETATAIARDVADAPDDTARAGMRGCMPGDSAVFSRHANPIAGFGSAIHATGPRDQCTCPSHGQRCALLMDAEDLLCPACRLACR